RSIAIEPSKRGELLRTRVPTACAGPPAPAFPGERVAPGWTVKAPLMVPLPARVALGRRVMPALKVWRALPVRVNWAGEVPLPTMKGRPLVTVEPPEVSEPPLNSKRPALKATRSVGASMRPALRTLVPLRISSGPRKVPPSTRTRLLVEEALEPTMVLEETTVPPSVTSNWLARPPLPMVRVEVLVQREPGPVTSARLLSDKGAAELPRLAPALTTRAPS